jgi:hypothetical protein
MASRRSPYNTTLVDIWHHDIAGWRCFADKSCNQLLITMPAQVRSGTLKLLEEWGWRFHQSCAGLTNVWIFADTHEGRLRIDDFASVLKAYQRGK